MIIPHSIAKISKSLFFILTLTLFPYSISHTQAQIATNNKTAKQTTKQIATTTQDNFQWQRLLDEAKKRVAQTVRSLKDLLVVIQNLNQGKEKEDQMPQHVIDTIKALIKETESLLSLSLADQLEKNDTQEIIIGKTISFAIGLLNANKWTVKAISRALAQNNNLVTIQEEFIKIQKELEEEQNKLKKSPILDIEEHIRQLEAENNTLRDQFDNQVTNFGLSFFNRQYRKMWNSRLGRIWEKNDLGSWALPVSGLAIASAACLYGVAELAKTHINTNIPTEKASYDTSTKTLKLGAGLLLATGSTALVNELVRSLFDNMKEPIKYKYYDLKDMFSKFKKSLHKKWQGGIHAQYAAEENEGPKVNLEDIIGLNPTAQQELQMLIAYLKNPEQYCLMNMQIQTGILLIGPPRTGKTLFGAVLASLIKEISPDTKLHIIAADTIDHWGISRIFAAARASAPCIIFIDEIHLIAAQSGMNNSRLSALLSEMDGINSKNKDPKKQVIVIGATNQPEVLDPALRKPGRFGTIIPFELPSYELRKETIRRKMDKLMVQCEHQQDAIDTIARNTAGANFEDLNQLVTNAFMEARVKNEIFTNKHLNQALYSSFYRIAVDNPNMSIPAEELKLLAIHFAGKALFATMSDSLLNLGIVTILPYLREIELKPMAKVDIGIKQDNDSVNKEKERLVWGNIYTYINGDSIGCKSQKELIHQAKLYLAGVVAEEFILGSASFSCHPDDIQKAVAIAMQLTCSGVNIQNMPKPEYAARYASALALIEGWKKEIRTLLGAHRDKLDRLVSALETNKILNQEEVLAIVK